MSGDTDPEADETFFVELSNVVNAAIADAQGECTIEDDDTPAPVARTVVLPSSSGSCCFTMPP